MVYLTTTATAGVKFQETAMNLQSKLSITNRLSGTITHQLIAEEERLQTDFPKRLLSLSFFLTVRLVTLERL